jgi:hypothetical protein
MDEKLRLTIEKIIRLTKENKEFDTELRKALRIDEPSANLALNKSEQLKNIEQYLGLDYYVENYKPSIINYSFIKEQSVQDQLISDNREMMRFRYGTRNHSIDFKEYCKYAHFQCETLLNYYFSKKCNTIEEIKRYIKNINPEANIDDRTTISSINFTTKFFTFNKEYNLETHYLTIDNIRETRNELSHRSIEKDKFLIEEYKNNLKALNLPLYKNGMVNKLALTKDENYELLRIFETQISKTPEYKKYCYLIWYNSTPYERINEAVKLLAEKVENEVKLGRGNR